MQYDYCLHVHQGEFIYLARPQMKPIEHLFQLIGLTKPKQYDMIEKCNYDRDGLTVYFVLERIL